VALLGAAVLGAAVLGAADLGAVDLGAVDLGAAASGAAGGGDGCWAEATDSGETASTTENTVTAILNPVIGLTSARLRRQLTQMLREFGNVKANRR
jgi:hypothetical protein